MTNEICIYGCHVILFKNGIFLICCFPDRPRSGRFCDVLRVCIGARGFPVMFVAILWARSMRVRALVERGVSGLT